MGKAKTLTAQEFRRVQDYIATRAHAARNRAMLLLTHLAGMRVGEVATLTWGDVVNTKGRVKDEIRMNADQTKGGHPRIVFLSPRLLKELECYVRSVKQREVDWSFLPLRKNLAGDSHPTRWPSISINSSEARALMAHPATAEDDHLQLH
jgi:integrase/recombinase XerD